jgi:two-component system sensor histidine kinase KdpD
MILSSSYQERPLSNHAPAAADPILVALGSEARTLRLVHTGVRMARELGRPWIAVHVSVPDWETANEEEQARVWLQEARNLGAATAWVRAWTVSDGLIQEGVGCHAALVVMGTTRPQGPWDRLERARAHEAIGLNLGARVVTVPLDPSPTGTHGVPRLKELLGIVPAIVVLLGLCAVFASALDRAVGFPGVPPVFALGIGFVAHRWGRAFSLSASAGVLALYHWLFTSTPFPYQTQDWTNVLYLAGTLLMVQIVVLLVDRLNQETRALRRGEAETLLIMLLGRALARCNTAREVAQVLVERLRGLFRAQAWMLVPGPGDTWVQLPETPTAPPSLRPSEFLPHFSDPSRTELSGPLIMNGCSYVALAGQGGGEGLLQLLVGLGQPLPPESWGLIQSLAVQGALALERVRWLEQAHQARLDTESEQMRNTLLGAVSHDLRTPLAAIQGAATSLLLPEPLPEATRQDLLAMIRDESDRLARLLSDLLDLTRLQSGAIRVRKEWQFLDEVVGSALLRQEARKGPLPIRVDLPESLPLVPLDGALMEQVLINLLANAHRHAPDTPVTLRAWEEPGVVQLEISDRGPGIPAEFHRQVFDKFFRMPGDLKDGGVGLGLAICGAIVNAHGGAIWVEDNPGGGARFRITLPLDGEPPAPLDPVHSHLTLGTLP